MTKEGYKKHREIIKAWAEEDAEIEVRDLSLPTWSKVTSPHWDKALEYRIKPEVFPDAPEGEQWFNPFNLSAEKFEINKGWRPLLVSEHCEGDFKKPQVDYDCIAGIQRERRFRTFRTKLPLPQAAKKLTVAEIESILGYKIKIVTY